jgi:hypothetical protein
MSGRRLRSTGSFTYRSPIASEIDCRLPCDPVISCEGNHSQILAVISRLPLRRGQCRLGMAHAFKSSDKFAQLDFAMTI